MSHDEPPDDFDAITDGVPTISAAGSRSDQIANMSHEQIFNLPCPHASWTLIDQEGDVSLTAN